MREPHPQIGCSMVGRGVMKESVRGGLQQVWNWRWQTGSSRGREKGRIREYARIVCESCHHSSPTEVRERRGFWKASEKPSNEKAVLFPPFPSRSVRMSFIDRIRYVHNEFVRMRSLDLKADRQWRKEVCQKIGLRIDENKLADSLRWHDNLFQIAFRDGEVGPTSHSPNLLSTKNAEPARCHAP